MFMFTPISELAPGKLIIVLRNKKRFDHGSKSEMNNQVLSSDALSVLTLAKHVYGFAIQVGKPDIA
jgi:hypothetical protein